MEGLAADLNTWAAAGLYDPHAPGADARLALLQHFAAAGLSLEELVAADARAALVTALSDKLLRGERPFSASDVAAASGIPLETVLRIWLAAGLPIDDPDGKVLPPDAVEITGLFFEGAKLFGEEGIFTFESLEDALTVMVRLVREHVVRAVQRSRAARGPDPSEPRELELAVCFLDLVNSTEWALRLPLTTASTALNRFETAAWDAAVQCGGRLVKLIGDEAMIIAPTAADGCVIALAVLDSAEHDRELPSARGAVGFGKVLFRDGDYFGPLVNLVARAAKEAAPWQALVTSTVRAVVAHDPRFTIGPVEPHRMRGIDEPVTLAPLK